jgi:organic radical activating enzyme
MNLKVSEIFYSLQGEGNRAGKPTIFIRLQGCSAKNSCFKMGILCDTEFESGSEKSLENLLDEISKYPSKEITWTGGEPCDQLTDEIVSFFKSKGYYQAIETSGIKRPPLGLDFICVSPKVAEHVLKRNFEGIEVDEIKYVRHKGQSIPSPSINAKSYLVSPHSNGFSIDKDNVNHCINLCLENPQWKLSIQLHKLWNIL